MEKVATDIYTFPKLREMDFTYGDMSFFSGIPYERE